MRGSHIYQADRDDDDDGGSGSGGGGVVAAEGAEGAATYFSSPIRPGNLSRVSAIRLSKSQRCCLGCYDGDLRPLFALRQTPSWLFLSSPPRLKGQFAGSVSTGSSRDRRLYISSRSWRGGLVGDRTDRKRVAVSTLDNGVQEKVQASKSVFKCSGWAPS